MPPPGNGSAVLHLEHYRGIASGSLFQTTTVAGSQVYDYVTPRMYNRRRDLLDPTDFHRLPKW